eukprot:4946955-Pyramimonas_sp.AAC.1
MMTKAIKEWDMIRPGDRLLLGLSGGKDSLALLHCLLAFQVPHRQECCDFNYVVKIMNMLKWVNRIVVRILEP